MEKKEIIIGGKTYPVEFTFQALLNFEEIAKQSFFKTNFEKIVDRIALIAAAVYAADEKTKLTVDDIMGTRDLKAIQDITAAFVIVMDLMNEYFEIPKVVQEAEKREDADDGDNASGEQDGDGEAKN
jgi:hypothetical protein